MNRNIASFLARVWGNRSGAVAILAGFLIFVLLAFSAIVVDLGYLFYAQRTLQASADAAALAGAQSLNVGTGGTAISVANAYSGISGGYNANANLTVTMASGYPQLKCFTSTQVSCGGSDSANAIVVVEQATVPLYFARVLGINSWQISAKATASAKGSVPVPLDVMIVLDTTASMNTNDPSCGTTRIQCALLGVQTLLGGNNNPYGLLPCSASCGVATNGNVANPIDEVGVMVFPGVTNATQAALDYDCSGSTPTIAAYNASPAPTYQIIPLSSDYRGSATGTTLNTGSNLVKAARGGATGCTQGLQAVGGVGTYYSDAIAAAQAALVANGRPNVQNVIILLGDGDADASSGNISAAKLANQCHQAITAAHNATTAGTWVYAIAYGASTVATSSCGSDTTPHISACSTLQQIASDATKFYSDATGSGACVSTAHPSYTDLQTIFKDIVFSTTNARLLPDNTT